MWACYKGQLPSVEFLLNHGARIDDFETKRNRTALYLAAE